MRKILTVFLLLSLCACRGEGLFAEKRAFEAQPFTALADVLWQGEAYAGAVCLGANGVLSMSLMGGALTEPVRFAYGNGAQEMAMGELSLRLPISDALPESIAAKCMSSLSAAAALGEAEASEDGSFCYEAGACSLTVEADGRWRELILEEGSLAFSDFTFSASGT